MHFKRLVQLFYQILLNLHYFNCSTYFSFFFLPVTVALMEILWPWLLWLRKIMDGGHGSIPSVQWFNSHGERLDTETNGETALSL